MGESVKVSVVVPVYNSQPYLRQCLDSLVGQTLEDIEIICVDDGSTDESPKILKEYAAADSRIRLIFQENQFAGVARNNGMAQARGEYIMFCDSDDWMEPTALEKNLAQCRKDDADICVCGCRQYFDRIGIEVSAPDYLWMSRIPEEVPFNSRTNSEHIFNFTTIMTHNKMYRLEFLRQHGLQYGATRNGEDVIFSALALWYAERITVLNEPLVCYRVDRADSLVGTLSVSALDPLKAWVEVWRRIGAAKGFPKRSFDNKFVGVIRHTFRSVSNGEASRACFDYLNGGVLDELDVTMREGDYYVDWINEFLLHLRSGSYDQFMAYLLFISSRTMDEEGARKRKVQQEKRQEKKAFEKRLKESKAETERVKNSRAYKIGFTLTKPYRWITGRRPS